MENKYRCWNIEKKEWVNLSILTADWGNCPQHYFNIASIHTQGYERTFLSLNDSEYYKWSKYTGKKDKDGTEIYEGDLLVGINGLIMEVVWGEVVCNAYAWRLELQGDAALPYKPYKATIYFEPEDLKIIGNIYEEKK